MSDPGYGKSPDDVWQQKVPDIDLLAGRFRPRRVLEEKPDYLVYEAEDTEAAGLIVVVRIYRWGSEGEYGSCWKLWHHDARR